MKYTKHAIIAVTMLTVGSGLAVWSGVQASTVELLSGSLNNQTVFANTYVSVGAVIDNQTINGNVLANQAVTIGAGGKITGNIQTGAALTTGDSAIITGNTVSGAASSIGANSMISGTLQSGAAVTLGANSQVLGTIEYIAAITNGDGATSGLQTQSSSSPVIVDEHTGVLAAQSALGNMTGELLTASSSLTTDTLFTAGVYDVPGYLTTAADVTITLDAQGQDSAFIFNVGTYMTLGAGTVVQVINGTPDTTVVWNITGGYASIGANVELVGTVLAEQYIIMGAGATAIGAGSSCGGVFSGRSYVTVGANVTVGTNDCTNGSINNMSITDEVAQYEVTRPTGGGPTGPPTGGPTGPSGGGPSAQ
jgi:predicted acyltransferase (DUF342 family)